METWKGLCLGPESTIKEAMETIGKGSVGIALVVDDAYHLLGVMTDGDIRRGLLRQRTLSDSVSTIMNERPVVASETDTRERVLALMERHGLQHIPLVNERGEVVGLRVLRGFLERNKKENWVFLIAGGQGMRLRPLTENCPKPLLNVGSRPILQNILESFIAAGFGKFIISVNYKAQMIMDFFGSGEKWGVEIRYVVEDSPLGTAGPLGLISFEIDAPLLVMNADLLTKVDFAGLLDFHMAQSCEATICVREYDFKIPYGVVESDGKYMKAIVEKPVHRFFVNAGIYVLNPSVLVGVEQDRPLDMPTLLDGLKREGQKVSVYPIYEYWLDIGHLEDYDRAQSDAHLHFGTVGTTKTS